MNKRFHFWLKRRGDGEGGQMTFLMVMTLLVVFMFFALGLDAGLWYFDHRSAQNQADADNDTSAATAAADQWLTRNNSSADERTCLEYSDRNGDQYYDTVRVCVRRQSQGLFAALSGVNFAWVSAAGAAVRANADMSNVMPWGIVPPDPTSDSAGEICQNDAN